MPYRINKSTCYVIGYIILAFIIVIWWGGLNEREQTLIQLMFICTLGFPLLIIIPLSMPVAIVLGLMVLYPLALYRQYKADGEAPVLQWEKKGQRNRTQHAIRKYIIKAQRDGHSLDHILSGLLFAGWLEIDVYEAFIELELPYPRDYPI